MRYVRALGSFLGRLDLLRFRLFGHLRVMRVIGCRNRGRSRDSERQTSGQDDTDETHSGPYIKYLMKMQQLLRKGIDLDQIFNRSER